MLVVNRALGSLRQPVLDLVGNGCGGEAQLLADDLGFLWVQDFEMPDSGALEWTIFDPEGVRSGRLVIPKRFYPLQIGSDYVLGLAWDEMGVEFIQVYALERPRLP